MSASITRRRCGKNFAYYDGERHITDKQLLAHIKSLANPTARLHVLSVR